MNDEIPEGAVLLYRKHGYTIYKFKDMYFLKGLDMDTTFSFVNRQKFKDFITAVFCAFCWDKRTSNKKKYETEVVE